MWLSLSSLFGRIGEGPWNMWKAMILDPFKAGVLYGTSDMCIKGFCARLDRILLSSSERDGGPLRRSSAA
jgi:hypothetical protein